LRVIRVLIVGQDHSAICLEETAFGVPGNLRAVVVLNPKMVVIEAEFATD